MEEPKGTTIFTTIGLPYYGFDVYSLHLPSVTERRLTDGVSVNFNASFTDTSHEIVFISERTGSAQVYRTRFGNPEPERLPAVPHSLFHDRPILRNNRLYFISAHEQPDGPFKSWSALYSSEIDRKEQGVSRLTAPGAVDYSPAVSRSGEYVAVASYGSRPWGGEFHALKTDIVVFRASNSSKGVVVCEGGGWPTWSGDSTIFFHRQADDGWWSIFQVDLPENFEDFSGFPVVGRRVTPSGIHCFTPAAFHDGKRIAVATRRRGNDYRHIEIFDTEANTLQTVTELVNPNSHHYNPFVSPDSEFIGYHRFRGESSQGESTTPYLKPVASPIKDLRLLRLSGSFPSSSPDGDLIAFNHDFNVNGGLMVVKSDGSRRWSLIRNRTAFYNSWSPTERHVVYTSLGPIFQPARVTVQIARVKFDPADLGGEGEDIPCEIKILTSEDSGNNAFPSCSPDGRSLVFRSGRSGHKNLYIIDAVNGDTDEGRVRRLTEGPWIDTMPCWSPTGDLIAFSSNMHNPDNTEAFGLYVVRPDGSDLRRIPVAGRKDAARERINHVSFSGDGEWMVFAANLSGVTAEPVALPNQFQPYGELYVMKVDGTGLRRLTSNAYENGTPTWLAGNELDLRRLSLDGGNGDKLKGQFDEPLWISCDI